MTPNNPRLHLQDCDFRSRARRKIAFGRAAPLGPHMRRAACILGLVVQSWTTVTRAEEPATIADDPHEAPRSRAEEAFWKGKHDYDQGKFDQARDQFEEAYRL